MSATTWSTCKAQDDDVTQTDAFSGRVETDRQQWVPDHSTSKTWGGSIKDAVLDEWTVACSLRLQPQVPCLNSLVVSLSYKITRILAMSSQAAKQLQSLTKKLNPEMTSSTSYFPRQNT